MTPPDARSAAVAWLQRDADDPTKADLWIWLPSGRYHVFKLANVGATPPDYVQNYAESHSAAGGDAAGSAK